MPFISTAETSTLMTQPTTMTADSQPNTTIIDTVVPLAQTMEKSNSTVPKTITNQLAVAINSQSGLITNISATPNDTKSVSVSKSTINVSVTTDYSRSLQLLDGMQPSMSTSPTISLMTDHHLYSKQTNKLSLSIHDSSLEPIAPVTMTNTPDVEISELQPSFFSSPVTSFSPVISTDPFNSQLLDELQHSLSSMSVTRDTIVTTADPLQSKLLASLRPSTSISIYGVTLKTLVSTVDDLVLKQTNSFQHSMSLAATADLLSSRLSVISPTPLMIADTFNSLPSKHSQSLASTSLEASMIHVTKCDHISSKPIDGTSISSATSVNHAPATEVHHSKSPNETKSSTASSPETPIAHVTTTDQLPNEMQPPISNYSVTSANPVTTIITDAPNSFSPNGAHLSTNRPSTNGPHGVFTATSENGSQIDSKHEGTSYGTTKPPEKGLAPTDVASLSLSADHTTVDNQMTVNLAKRNKHVIIGFFDQPVGKAVAFAVLAALFILVFCLVWKRLSTKSGKHMSRLVGKPTMWFPTRPDTNRPVQTQKRARILKFRF